MVQSYLLLKQHGVDGLPAGQDHHGEAHSHGHHEAHSDHLRHKIRGKIHQHIPSYGVCKTYIAKEPHL